MNFVRDLASSNVLYWRQPNVAFSHVLFLLLSNSLLLVLCKSASFGLDNVGAAVVTALIAFLIQYFAAIACLVRDSDGGLQSDAPKLAKTITLVWLLSLILFSPNAIPGARWFDVISSYWLIAAIHSAAALLLITYYSARRVMRGHNSIHFRKFAKQSIGWISFYFAVNTVLFYLFVLDTNTHFWILDNYEKLALLFK